jgi:hypothetical protein
MQQNVLFLLSKSGKPRSETWLNYQSSFQGLTHAILSFSICGIGIRRSIGLVPVQVVPSGVGFSASLVPVASIS